MKLSIFQSDKGDCLLLEGAGGGRMLCDGGMAASMRKHVRAELAKLRRPEREDRLRLRLAYRPGSYLRGAAAAGGRARVAHVRPSPEERQPDPKPPRRRGRRRSAGSGTTRFASRSTSNAGRVEDLLAAAVAAVVRDARYRSWSASGRSSTAHRDVDPRSDQGLAVRVAGAARHSPQQAAGARAHEPKLLMVRQNQALIQRRFA